MKDFVKTSPGRAMMTSIVSEPHYHYEKVLRPLGTYAHFFYLIKKAVKSDHMQNCFYFSIV